VKLPLAAEAAAGGEKVNEGPIVNLLASVATGHRKIARRFFSVLANVSQTPRKNGMVKSLSQ
jgi:hypothetical protein